MELRSGRRLRSQSPAGAHRRCRPRRRTDGAGTDRISNLPVDLLLQVLVRLRCARAAVLTGALSRRWRGLWTHLTELSFGAIAPDALCAALKQVVCPALSRLKIDVPKQHTMDPARVSVLLHAASRLAPADLDFRVWGHTRDKDIAINIPCFDRAVSIKLDVINLYLVPPAEGVQFPALKRLSIAGCRINIDELILRCPHLREVEVCNCWGLSTIRVHSPTIENLSVEHGCVEGIDIMAPLLKQLNMSAFMDAQFSVSFSAPMLKTLCLSFWCPCIFQNVGIGGVWRLRYLQLEIENSMQVLYLSIDAPVLMQDTVRNFSQEIAPLPAFSYLHLGFARGHVFGAIVVNILGVCSTIQRLIVRISQSTGQKPCLPNCSCDEPQIGELKISH